MACPFTILTQVIDFQSQEMATGVVTGHAEQRRESDVWVMAVRYTDAYRRVRGVGRFAQKRLDYRYRLRVQEYARLFGQVRQ